MNVNTARILRLNERPFQKGPVIYWMSRDQRLEDNWALIHACDLAREMNEYVVILFCLVPSFPGASARAYDFMLKGLMELEPEARRLNLGFAVVSGEPPAVVPEFVGKIRAGMVVADFSPLNVSKQWKRELSESLDIAE